MNAKWTALLNTDRRQGGASGASRAVLDRVMGQDCRNEHERDYDRIVFSSPVRRLQDKTQVFPLDHNDSIHTRLTHSIEVANIARMLGIQFAVHLRGADSGDRIDYLRAIPALVSAISMAHDVGNPPFGHQGEAAIRGWAKSAIAALPKDLLAGCDHLVADYCNFDGNPQGFRLLASIQGFEGCGLNLTASTLRATFKYPWSSTDSRVSQKKPKFGFFQSEKAIFEWASKQTGVTEGLRHPLSLIMEAADDICYSLLDIEDGVKKGLVSTADLIQFIRRNGSGTMAADWASALGEWYDETMQRLDDNGVDGRYREEVLMEMLRSVAIGLIVTQAIPSLVSALDASEAVIGNPCVDNPACEEFLGLLKKFTATYIYTHSSVIRVELQGHDVIPYLLGAMWAALGRILGGVQTKHDEYVAARISKNYMRNYRSACEAELFPEWYLRLQLVCDMVCGMTDSFALRMASEFREVGVKGY